ncbi:VOC family protein [Micromonospora sp. NPDC051296]|uniref:VOC family protein n=1 Tax=Micromonospora sp. NPDC051296 TaxID=3155046 RepID=UPI00344AA290
MIESPLREAPLLFVFIDISSLPRHRRLCEDVLGFRVVENQFHPPHEHHGLVKYDAGGTILALNLFTESKFRQGTSDALTLVCRTAGGPGDPRLDAYGTRADGLFTDRDGHHFVLGAGDSDRGAEIVEVRLAVSSLTASVPFYRDVLGLELRDQDADSARFATGTVDLTLELCPDTPDGRKARFNGYLVVFHVPEVRAAAAALAERGLAFRGPVGFSDIGGTVRFNDPTGHVLCLYEPSAESLTWGSADKVRELTARRTHRL